MLAIREGGKVLIGLRKRRIKDTGGHNDGVLMLFI